PVVEQPPYEGLFEVIADQIEIPGGLQPDFIQGRCQVIVLIAVAGFAEGFREAKGKAAAFPEALQGGGHFLHLGWREIAIAEAKDYACDTLVAACPLEHFRHHPDGGGGVEAGEREETVRWPVAQPLGTIKLQQDTLRQFLGSGALPLLHLLPEKPATHEGKNQEEAE